MVDWGEFIYFLVSSPVDVVEDRQNDRLTLK